MGIKLNELTEATVAVDSDLVHTRNTSNVDKKMTFENFFNRDINIKGDLSLLKVADEDREINFASDAKLLWDESETEFYFDKSVKVDNGIETDGTKLKTKIIEIGNWNMDATSTLNVPHGLGANYKNIRGLSGIIRDDNDMNYYSIPSSPSGGSADVNFYVVRGVSVIDNTNIPVERKTGGNFDHADFNNAAAYNRGWITITYEA